MVTDNANGGTIQQQHEVLTRTQGHALSVQSGVGATDALRIASAPGARSQPS